MWCCAGVNLPVMSVEQRMNPDTSQADGSMEFRVTKENDLNLIRIGNERYEIPDAVVLGG